MFFLDGIRELFQLQRDELLSPRVWLVGFGYTSQLFGLGGGVAMELAARNDFEKRHLVREVLLVVGICLLGTLVSGTIGEFFVSFENVHF